MSELYFVRPGDTLAKIAMRFGVSIQELLDLNAICNPNLIFVGTPILIPAPEFSFIKTGGIPYYVIQPGDSLWCISQIFNIPLKVLAKNNKLSIPNRVFAGQELLIINQVPNLGDLKMRWENLGGPNCEIYDFQVHGLYIDTFAWEAIGRRAVPYLLELLNHPCMEVRYYALISLGRIGFDHKVIHILKEMLNNCDRTMSDLMLIVLKRLELIRQGKRRIHLLLNNDRIFFAPSTSASSEVLPQGTEIVVLRWNLASPSGEEGARGGIQIFDYVKILKSRQTGFLARWGYNEINLI